MNHLAASIWERVRVRDYERGWGRHVHPCPTQNEWNSLEGHGEKQLSVQSEISALKYEHHSHVIQPTKHLCRWSKEGNPLPASPMPVTHLLHFFLLSTPLSLSLLSLWHSCVYIHVFLHILQFDPSPRYVLKSSAPISWYSVYCLFHICWMMK